MDGRPCPSVLFRRTFACKIFLPIFLKFTGGYWVTYIEPMCQTKIHGEQKEMNNARIWMCVDVDVCAQPATRHGPPATHHCLRETPCRLPEIHRRQIAAIGACVQPVITQSAIRSRPVHDLLSTLLYSLSPGPTHRCKRHGKANACRQAMKEKAE